MSVFSFSCGDDYDGTKPDIVNEPEQISEHVVNHIERMLDRAGNESSRINDSTVLHHFELTKAFYSSNNQNPVWSDAGRWLPIADSLVSFIDSCRVFGLFPGDYHLKNLASIRQQTEDTLRAKDALLWTTGDLLMTDAFLSIAKDIKQGRIPVDTITGRRDSLVDRKVYVDILKQFVQGNGIYDLMHSLEPLHEGYVEIRQALPSFIDSAEFRRSTYISYPMKDSMALVDLVQRRMFELDYLVSPKEEMDTTAFRQLISRYQKKNNLKVTGKLNQETVNKLNMTDLERFKIIALTLDKYKQIPDTMPATRVWVNIPSYWLKVFADDTVTLESRVIVGASKTPTPEIVSMIGNFVTYPQWTVPFSIIHKEMIPKIQKDINYIVKQNLMVVDRNDNVVDPKTIDWKKMSKKYFPYQIKQRQGDDNSLGVMKFNFRNKHSVYLHDTNARWLFQKSQRSLSHGCVRVQKWKELAEFLVRNDTLKIPVDSLNNWIARKEKRVVSGFERVPIFIRYFTCEAREGKIRFYEDIYGSDRILRERYFANKL
jgi:L,D-transpeptidase YcbB